MRVLIASTQGAGHFNPLLPYADACRRAGHEVLVVGPPSLAGTVARAGLEFRAGASPPPEELGPVWERVPSLSREEGDRVVIGEIFARLNVAAMRPHIDALFDEWRPELVLREPAEFASAIVAEERGVPHLRAGISLAFTEEAFLGLAGPSLEEQRPGIGEAIWRSPYLTTFPASLEEVDGAVLPPELSRCRDPAEPVAPAPGDDQPLVYVSFGSVTGAMPMAAGLYANAIEAVAELPAQVLVTVGRDLDIASLGEPPANVKVVPWVPQAEVLGVASVVVCHGGSGTMLGALAAGLPLVVVPLFADQPLNAARVGAVGAGVFVEGGEGDGPIRTSIDPVALRAAIGTVLRSDSYAVAARRIADEMAALPPIDDALAALLARYSP